jgi:spore germination protein KA
MIEGIVYGNTLVPVDGLQEALLFDTKNFKTRSASEPEGEKVLSGPREDFTEALMRNMGMVRRKLRTENLKMRFFKAGRRTKTQLCVAYLDGVARPEVVRELFHRLEQIDIDGVLDANYINELIRDKAWSPFRSMCFWALPSCRCFFRRRPWAYRGF